MSKLHTSISKFASGSVMPDGGYRFVKSFFFTVSVQGGEEHPVTERQIVQEVAYQQVLHLGRRWAWRVVPMPRAVWPMRVSPRRNSYGWPTRRKWLRKDWAVCSAHGYSPAAYFRQDSPGRSATSVPPPHPGHRHSPWGCPFRDSLEIGHPSMSVLPHHPQIAV